MQKYPAQDIPALAVEDVSKVYWQWQRGGTGKDVLKNLLHPQKRRVQALDGLNLTVNAGEFVAYAGANGAGKSTTIKILAGILQPSEGRVRVLGMDPAKDRVRLMARIGVLFGQRSELWWDYPVIASYEWKRAVWNIPQEKYDEKLNFATEILELGPILNTFARELSLGQKMRADLGMLLLHDPQVIFLDEPTLGLDLLAKRSLIRALKTLNRQHGTTILVTSHDMDDLQEMADRIVLLSRGRLAYDGTFAALRHGEAGQGGQVRIRVQSAGGTLPPVEGLRHLATQNGESLYALDTQTTNINQALAAIATLPGIRDIEIQQPSIEDVIARLYQSWAAQ